MKRRRFRPITMAAGALVLAAGVVIVPTAPTDVTRSGAAYAATAQVAACDAPAWDADTVYTGGEVVSYEGHEWRAKWWSRGYEPSGYQWGPWQDLGPCDGGGGEEDTQAPTVPTGLAVTVTTSSSVSLAWNASSDNVGVTDYIVYRDGNQTAVVSDTNVTVSGLAPSTTYTFTVAARDAAGNTSAPSDPVTATTDPDDGGGGGGPLPAHTLTGYWHNFLNGSTALEISDVPASYDVIAVAFGVGGDRPGEVTFNLNDELQQALGGYSKAEFIADIRAKQAAGKTVILSIGGAAARINLGGPEGATRFANSVYDLMQEYGFDGVDIDLEGAFNPDLLASALHQLANLAGDDFVLTMAPQTLFVQPRGSYLQLIKQTDRIITTVHTQYYNSGSMLGCNGTVVGEGDVDFLTAQACILLRKALDADQVAFGLPATPQAAGSGYVDPALIKRALSCMAYGTNCGDFQPNRTYPEIRGVMTWSINWDATTGYQFASSIAPYLNSLPG